MQDMPIENQKSKIKNAGFAKCETLKKIRQMIADKNGIDYHTTECKFQGHCPGTCPKCEAELRYLESELQKRKSAGRKVAVAGLALGISMATSCVTHTPPSELPDELPGDICVPVRNYDSLADGRAVEVTAKRDTAKGCQPNQKNETKKDKKGKTANPEQFLEYIEVLEGDVVSVDDDCIFYSLDDDSVYADAPDVTAPPDSGDQLMGIVYEVFAEFPGGDAALSRYIAESIVYPKEAADNDIQGRVYLIATLDEQGDVIDVEVTKGVDPLLDAEAVRVIRSLPRFKPAMVGGRNVKSEVALPVKFEL